MKKTGIFAFCAFAALVFASCNKTDYTAFVGTWGVEKIEYYNIDYAGNPIDASMTTYYFDPNNTDNGIRLVFRENKTGEMRDNNIDTVGVNYDPYTGEFESYIYNPDTTSVATFTYSYDKSESTLYLNIKYTYPYEYSDIFEMKIEDLGDNSFIYENEYKIHYVERAYLKRLSGSPTKAAGQKAMPHPRKLGSFLGGR